MVPSASFEPSSFEAPADRTSSKASKKHCRDRPAASTATHRPCSRARQTSGGGRVQNPLAGGTELTFCSLVPSGASQSGAAPDRGTARNRRGFHGTRWAHAPRGLVSPQSAAGSTVWPEEGGRVVGCEHPGRSQKPHEKRRNCLPPPRCCHVALLQGQGPGPDRWRACAWDEGRGPGSRRRPCCPHSPHCVAAGCWQPTLTPGTSELQCWRVPKLGPALCPRTGHAARWAVMDTRSRLALQDDGWAGTEGPSFCAPLARYGTLLRSRPVQAPCIISTQTWCGVPNGDPWDLVPFPRCLPRSSHLHGYPAAHAAPSLPLPTQEVVPRPWINNSALPWQFSHPSIRGHPIFFHICSGRVPESNPTRRGYLFDTFIECATVTHTCGQLGKTARHSAGHHSRSKWQMVPPGGRQGERYLGAWLVAAQSTQYLHLQYMLAQTEHRDVWATSRATQHDGPMESDPSTCMDQTKAKVLPLPPDCSA